MKQIEIENFNINPFTQIGKSWMLVSSGNKQSFNCMTASWGSLGALWGKTLDGRPVATIYIRPSRYTDSFIDTNEYFTICFFDESYKKDLLYLGSKSGREENKLLKTNLHPVFVDDNPIYEEAKMVLVCKKIYKGKIYENGFIEKEIISSFYKKDNNQIYNNDSYHNVYVGGVVKILVKE